MHGAVLLIFFDDCSTVVYGVKHITINGEGIEMLTPKQILQRLSVHNCFNNIICPSKSR